VTLESGAGYACTLHDGGRIATDEHMPPHVYLFLLMARGSGGLQPRSVSSILHACVGGSNGSALLGRVRENGHIGTSFPKHQVDKHTLSTMY
jgi:hypothetical protein